MAQWPSLEADFHSEYGVDLAHPDIRTGRTWRWFLVRVGGLLSADTRLARILLRPSDSPTQPDPESDIQ